MIVVDPGARPSSRPAPSPIEEIARNTVELVLGKHGAPREVRINPCEVELFKTQIPGLPAAAADVLATLPVVVDPKVPPGHVEIIKHVVPLWLVSWNQAADQEHGVDSRPTVWPPPAPVLAFWEAGRRGEGDEAFSTIIALVRAEDEAAITTIIRWGWSPGVTKLRFVIRATVELPPLEYPPPPWSVEIGRWPWEIRPPAELWPRPRFDS